MTFLIFELQRDVLIPNVSAVGNLCTCLPFLNTAVIVASINLLCILLKFISDCKQLCKTYLQRSTPLNFAVPPSIHRGQENRTVNESSNLELFCNATGNPSPNITWSNAANPSFKLASDEVLIVKNVSKNDSGVYQCMASNGIGRDALTSWIVTVNCKSKRKMNDHHT